MFDRFLKEVFFRQEWLRTTGSPKARIDRVLFNEIEEINDYTFDSFKIV